MIRRRGSRQDGFILPAVAMIMILLGIMIPAFVLMGRKDTKDAVSSAKRATALQLAEAGQDRGVWKLRESGTIWTSISSGTAIAGYAGDVEHADVSGGKYKIAISSGPSSGQITVISKGRPNGSTVVRTVRGIYSKDGTGTALGALTVNGALTWRPNMTVHWGSVVSYTSISSPADYFPRKYSAGQITGRDTVDDANNGAMPGENWVTYDYASFYELGVPPTINLNAYRTRAKALTGIAPMKNATQNPAGSGYFTPTASGGLDIDKPSGSGGYIRSCSTCVFFVEGSVKKFPNASRLTLEALIVTGDMDYNADSLTVTANIPAQASAEYQHSSLGGYFAGQGWTNGGTASISGVGMKGFLYVGGDMGNAGGGAILVGAMFLVGDMNCNTFTIYYDSSIANAVQTDSNGQVYRASWDEIVTTW